jgi:hypothetical protein
MPTANWLFQVSQGRIADPEHAHAGTVVRTTASAHYTRGNWSSSLIWGRNDDLDSYLAETVWSIARRNWFTGRFELVQKDELAIAGAHLVGAYTAGYTRDLGVFGHVQTGINQEQARNCSPPRIAPLAARGNTRSLTVAAR